VPNQPELNKVNNYFAEKIKTFGPTPQGVDYNSAESQEVRFFQLTKVLETNRKYSLLDFGSGYGALYDYLLRLGHKLHYFGYDISEAMIEKGRELHQENVDCLYTCNIDEIPPVDYSVASGTFNMKLDIGNDEWTRIVIDSLNNMDKLSLKGIAFNMLTKYSDPEKMRSDLYYGDPLFFFDYCKNHYSKNVALLHDYRLYDFTLIIRKD
jgi:SAM-dependent methyltransferase